MNAPNPSRGDYFSRQAAEYAQYRPRYPAEMIAYYASTVAHRRLAWDCATGNGQLAVPLAAYFDRVVATDISAEQLARAERHEHVEYRVAPAEASGLATASADLITVAQALHWFDLDAFYAEAHRVLAPGGVLGVSSYGSAAIVDAPVLASLFNDFESKIVGPYWPPRRELVGEALRSLPFPFAELEAPDFQLEVDWTLPALVGYARSWSATARYIAAHGDDPTVELQAALQVEWGPPEQTRRIRWPFVVRAGARRPFQPSATW